MNGDIQVTGSWKNADGAVITIDRKDGLEFLVSLHFQSWLKNIFVCRPLRKPAIFILQDGRLLSRERDSESSLSLCFDFERSVPALNLLAESTVYDAWSDAFGPAWLRGNYSFTRIHSAE